MRAVFFQVLSQRKLHIFSGKSGAFGYCITPDFLPPRSCSFYKLWCLFRCKKRIQLLLLCSNDIIDSRIIQCLQELWKQFVRIS